MQDIFKQREANYIEALKTQNERFQELLEEKRRQFFEIKDRFLRENKQQPAPSKYGKVTSNFMLYIFSYKDMII
jgi:hypothetical protein